MVNLQNLPMLSKIFIYLLNLLFYIFKNKGAQLPIVIENLDFKRPKGDLKKQED